MKFNAQVRQSFRHNLMPLSFKTDIENNTNHSNIKGFFPERRLNDFAFFLNDDVDQQASDLPTRSIDSSQHTPEH